VDNDGALNGILTKQPFPRGAGFAIVSTLLPAPRFIPHHIMPDGRNLSSLNLCNIPPWTLASVQFNRNPRPIEIQGARRTHGFLFDKLKKVKTWEERAALFQDYMDVAFHLHQWKSESSRSGRLSLKNSYLRYLRGWMFDSNSIEAAALKGWAESRFGLPATFHVEKIEGRDTEAHFRFMVHRTKGLERTSALYSQLDVLYEYGQFELNCRLPSETHRTLYRGVHDFSEHEIKKETAKNKFVLRFNNLNSFTSDFEKAWEFGTKVLEVKVPLCKIFFDGSFLHSSILKGEEEAIVIGGDYDALLRLY